MADPAIPRDRRVRHAAASRAGPAALVTRRVVWCALSVLAVMGVAGCKDEKKAVPPAAAAAPAAQKVMEAAEQNIQSAATAPAKVQFRGVQVYTQADPQRMAVCGQVSPFADDATIFVPFVSVVTAQRHGGWTEYGIDQRIGTTTSEASRVYAAIVTYCYDNGGPSQSPLQGVAATPPLPDAIPDPQAHAAVTQGASAAKPEATAPTEASGTVTLRQNANLRSDPHGPSIRVMAQGTSLRVFGQAPGGWYQVGDTAPLGWVHESMLDRR